jgi:hypothetical protein
LSEVVAVLWIIGIVLLAVRCEQRSMEEYPGRVIEETMLVSIQM